MAHPPFRKTVPAFGAAIGPSYSALATGAIAANAVAGIRVNSSGIIETREGSTYTNQGTWLVSGAASDYDFRITSISGTTPSGSAANTWLNGGSSREWTIQDGLIDGVEVFSQFTLEVSLAGAATAQDSASVDLTSERI